MENFAREVERYIPPELRPVVEAAGMFNPVQGIMGGMGAAGRGDYGDAAVETILGASPLVAARLMRAPAKAALAELFGFGGGLGSVEPSLGSGSRRRVSDELSEELSSGLGAPVFSPSDFGFTHDNPGGRWLREKQQAVEERMASGGSRMSSRGITGSVTGTMGMRTDMFLPTDILSTLKGASGENRAAGDPKFDDLMASVREEGFDPNQKGNRVVISVNHRGEPYLMEGNTRVAVARELGVPSVRAEVRYWNGGEEVDGAFAPDVISRVASPGFSSPSGGSAGRASSRDVSPDDLQPSEGMTRRRFLGGLGAVTAAGGLAGDLPLENLARGLGRSGVRGGVKAIDELMGLMARRNALYDEQDKEIADFMGSHGEYEDLLGEHLDEKFGSLIREAEKAVSKRISASDISLEELEGLPDRTLKSLLSEISFDDYIGPDELGQPDLELADRIREVLASRAPQSEVGSMLPDVTSRVAPPSTRVSPDQDMVGPEGLRLLHGTPRSDLTLDDIQIVREGAKQGRRGRKTGGFYTTSVDDAAQAEGYARMAGGQGRVMDVTIAPGTRILRFDGDITRLSEDQIDNWTDQGYGLVIGKDVRGRTEYVVIDRDAIQGLE